VLDGQQEPTIRAISKLERPIRSRLRGFNGGSRAAWRPCWPEPGEHDAPLSTTRESRAQTMTTSLPSSMSTIRTSAPPERYRCRCGPRTIRARSRSLTPSCSPELAGSQADTCWGELRSHIKERVFRRRRVPWACPFRRRRSVHPSRRSPCCRSAHQWSTTRARSPWSSAGLDEIFQSVQLGPQSPLVCRQRCFRAPDVQLAGMQNGRVTDIEKISGVRRFPSFKP